MELYTFKFDGIYDSRTLSELKQEGVSHFCFDFNPRSFNFIQERVFLDLVKNNLNETDKIFLHFTNNKDFMCHKIYHEILKIRGGLHNVFFEFDDYFPDHVLPNEMKFFLLYQPSILLNHTGLDNIAGFIFSHELLSKINKEGNLVRFYSNFFTHFKSVNLDSKVFILKLGWNETVNSKCLDVFDFNLVSLPLDNEIEVCYRNVDLHKLKLKFNSAKKIFSAPIQL